MWSTLVLVYPVTTRLVTLRCVTWIIAIPSQSERIAAPLVKSDCRRKKRFRGQPCGIPLVYPDVFLWAQGMCLKRAGQSSGDMCNFPTGAD